MKPIVIKYIEIIHRCLNSFLEIPQIKYSHIFKITYSKFVKFSQISVKGTDTAKLLKCQNVKLRQNISLCKRISISQFYAQRLSSALFTN